MVPQADAAAIISGQILVVDHGSMNKAHIRPAELAGLWTDPSEGKLSPRRLFPGRPNGLGWRATTALRRGLTIDYEEFQVRNSS